jgi:amidase
MNAFPEYDKYDACGLAELVKDKQVSPAELMECAVERAQQVNPALNALRYENYEESLELARNAKLTGPFAAIPFLLKDSGIPATRFPSSVGSVLLEGSTYRRNSELVNRIEQAGLITFARTAVPELCMGTSTEATANNGPTRNPWNLENSAGGSSGGAAAAVAAGVVPLAHGSDGGGSIRVPAACCGLYGLKPSRGRLPTGPDDGETWGDLISDGFLSRSVRDTAAALDAVHGADAGAPFTALHDGVSYLSSLSMPFQKPLRIAVWRSGWDSIDAVDRDTVDAVNATAKICQDLGHEVIDMMPPDLGYEEYAAAHTNALALSIGVAVDAALKMKGRSLREGDLEPATLSGYHYGKTLTGMEYAAAMGQFRRMGRKLGAYMQDYDLILTPTVPVAAIKLGRFPKTTDFLEFRGKVCRYNAFTSIANASGQPAVSIPVYWNAEGLPVGSQLIARYGREDVLLRISAQIETAAPWFHRRPTL